MDLTSGKIQAARRPGSEIQFARSSATCDNLCVRRACQSFSKNLFLPLFVLCIIVGCKTGVVVEQPRSARGTDCECLLSSVRLQEPARSSCSSFDCEHDSLAPITVNFLEAIETWDLTLDEAIQIGLANSTVLRDLGGQVVRRPESVPDKYQIGLTSADPRFGVEAALSAFDAQLFSRATFANNDRVFNNEIAGLGVKRVQTRSLQF